MEKFEKLENKITVCLSDDMLQRVKSMAKKYYFKGVQDYIRMAVVINLEVDEEKNQEC